MNKDWTGNKKSTFVTLGASNHSEGEREINDFYATDPNALEIFLKALERDNFKLHNRIWECEWDKEIEVDLIMHGSPCQDFSLAGKQAGGDKDSGTRSSLMYETLRIVEKLKPKYVIWENVKNLLSKKHRHNFDAYLETMERLGYTNYYQVLNAKDYGIPQNRERVFTVSILGNENYEFPNKQDEANLQDFLEEDTNIKTKPMCEKAFNIEYEQIITSDKAIYQCNVSSGYQDCKVGVKVSPTIRSNNNCTHVLQKFKFPPKQELKSKCKRLKSLIEKTEFEEGRVLNMDLYNQTTNENISQCLTEPHHNTQRLFDGLRIRKITPKEAWRLMGFDDEDFEKAEKVNSNTQLYKQAGNSIVVNVLEAILRNLLEILEDKE